MSKRFTSLLVLLAFSVAILAFLLVYSLGRVGGESAASRVTHSTAIDYGNEGAGGKSDMTPSTPEADRESAVVSSTSEASLSHDATNLPVEVENVGTPDADQMPPGYIPLSASPVAKAWANEMGTTVDDILTAQARMRKEGFPAHMIDDPSLVRQFLPRRNVSAVNIHTFEIPERSPSGHPVPFRMTGALPDRSFQFTRFEVTRQDAVIRIRALGDTTGEIVPGVEVPVDLEGEIEPLPPGLYRIEFSELGPEAIYELIIE